MNTLTMNQDTIGLLFLFLIIITGTILFTGFYVIRSISRKKFVYFPSDQLYTEILSGKYEKCKVSNDEGKVIYMFNLNIVSTKDDKVMEVSLPEQKKDLIIWRENLTPMKGHNNCIDNKGHFFTLEIM